MTLRRALALTVTAVLAAACGDNSAGPDAVGACSDGVDNDGDTLEDFPADPGCDDANDGDEGNPPIAQCSDGRDNDADGFADFPEDPGCFDPLANSEADDCPTGPNCPECGNNADDDTDGLTDFPDDLGCDAASDDEEYLTNPNACGPGIIVTRLDADDATGTFVSGGPSVLQSPTCGGVGDEVAYELVFDEPTFIIVTTDRPGTTANTVLYLRSDCTMPATELTCSDDITGGTNLKSEISASLPAGVFYLIVDNHDLVTAGNFEVHIDRFAGEGVECTMTSDCGPGLVCRVPLGGSEMVCAQPVCNDTLDDDADGTPDFPGDPGCDSPNDATEEDDCPNGPSCPACANGVDDDGDTMIDYPADPDCNSASQPVEGCASEQDPIFVLSTPSVTDDLTGLNDDFDLSCDGTAPHLDRVHFVTLPQMTSITFETENSTTDTAVALLPSTCGPPELGCDDDGGASMGASKLVLIDLAAGTYALVVENYGGISFPPGPYNLGVSGEIAPGGRCDGALATAGALVCGAAYTCGAGGTCIGSLACNNGVDDDADALIDFPADPGCTSSLDTDEADDCPDGPSCPACANGIDDDGDLQVDYPDDTSCSAASGASESCSGEDDPILTLEMGTVTGDLTGFSDDLSTSCGFFGGEDQVLLVELPATTTITFDTEGSAMPDTVLALHPPTCSGTSLACDDDSGSGNLSLLTVNGLAAGSYALVVASYPDAGAGAYTVNTTGIIAPGGACDGPLATAGALVCDTGYTCTGGVCLGTLACNNGADDDGDGLVDFPADPGCISSTDTDETDTCPGGAGCPECGNDLDDDGSGEADYPDDPTCASASDPSEGCASTEPVIVVGTPTLPGTTVGATNDLDLACGSSAGGSPDLVYAFDLPATTTVTITTEPNNYDAVVALFDASCGGAPLVCNDGPESATGNNLAAGRYYFQVDGWNAAASGSFQIGVSGVIANGASCEGPLAGSGALTCGATAACQGVLGFRTCQPAECADSVDQDGDGFTGYPLDPGCASLSDTDEADDCPSGPTCPQCSNDLDDDGDGQTDYPADVACQAASGSEIDCTSESDPILMVMLPTTNGTTVGATNDHTPACQTNSTALDVTYSLVVPVTLSTLTVDTETSSFDTVLTIDDASCAPPPIECDDDDGVLGDGFQSLITRTDVAPGTYYLTIDGYQAQGGGFALNTRGVATPGASCLSPLFAAGVLTCASGETCTAGTCQ